MNAYFRSSEYFVTERGCSSGILSSHANRSRFLTRHDISGEMSASYDRAEQVAVCLGTRIYRLLRYIFAAMKDRRGAKLRFLNVERPRD